MNPARIIATAILLSIIPFVTASSTVAQMGARIERPFDRPAVSPYLNLFRNNNNRGAALNYFGLVRPQLQSQEAERQLGRQLQTLQQRQLAMQQNALGPRQRVPVYSHLGATGHPTAFMTNGPIAGGSAGAAPGFAVGTPSVEPSVGRGFRGGIDVGTTGPGQFAGPAGVTPGGTMTGHAATFGTNNTLAAPEN